ncbi:CTP-dependent riboflavin kinase [Methanothermococcus thermolithotrophicus]|uniref:CTP-dependent riboflavin kinase n=1 Tax=Methanothermococcus thermolithotrophicus TaxID=2186 RepID=UPI00037F368C|nr:CTP-dependent riboflavin kinase [Methanothermococcus thermolithotrophicus]MDK2987691.1 riboflavin kinase, archaea type [Methanothermococcus sp.]
MKFLGRLVPGRGEGSYYMSLPPYKQKFKEILGFEPYEGTLNIKLNETINLDKLNPLEVGDFYYNNKKFYGLKVIPVTIINKEGHTIDGAIVAPKKTCHSSNILEIIAPIKLRKFLSLSNGDIVKIVTK